MLTLGAMTGEEGTLKRCPSTGEEGTLGCLLTLLAPKVGDPGGPAGKLAESDGTSGQVWIEGCGTRMGSDRRFVTPCAEPRGGGDCGGPPRVGGCCVGAWHDCCTRWPWEPASVGAWTGEPCAARSVLRGVASGPPLRLSRGAPTALP